MRYPVISYCQRLGSGREAGIFLVISNTKWCATYIALKSQINNFSLTTLEGILFFKYHKQFKTLKMFGEIPGAQDCICMHSFTINLVSIPMHPVIPHTTQNGQNKQSKMLTLETTIFGLKMLVKNGLEFSILKFYVPHQKYLLTCQANSAVLGRFFCTGQQQLGRGTQDFKIKNSRLLFTIIFTAKMLVSRPEIFIHLFYEFQVVCVVQQ